MAKSMLDYCYFHDIHLALAILPIETFLFLPLFSIASLEVKL
jgi:hypothetical protein